MKTTVKMLCARANIARAEIPLEAQKLLELYEDPSIPPEKKDQVKKQLDAMISKMEDRAETSRRLREEGGKGKD